MFDFVVIYQILSFILLIYNEFLNGTFRMKWPETPAQPLTLAHCQIRLFQSISFYISSGFFELANTYRRHTFSVPTVGARTP